MTLTIDTCTLRNFMECLFHGRTELVGGEEAWDKIYTEFIDLSGAANTRECTISRQIHNVQIRIAWFKAMLDLQYRFLEQFEIPFVTAFDDFKRKSHKLKWNGDIEEFKQQLFRVDVKERKNIAELDRLFKEMSDLKKDGMTTKNITDNSRKEFVTLINVISKDNGYRINKDEVTVEEFALMIKSYSEAKEAQQNAQ
jgi:hypothetical protein